MPRPRPNADPSMAPLVEPPRLTPLELRWLRRQVDDARRVARRAARGWAQPAGTARELQANAARLEAALRIRATRQARF